MRNSTCTFPGCERPHESKGHCKAHAKQRRKGHELSPIKSRALPYKLETPGQYYVNSGANECWEWLGTIEAVGYGVIYRDGKLRKAHRVVWEDLVGQIPEGLVLDHRCHNKSCVNPSHLRVVTQKQNIEHLRGANKNSRSGHRNVIQLKNGSYSVQLRHNRKLITVGTFVELDDAVKAAAEARAKYFTCAD